MAAIIYRGSTCRLKFRIGGDIPIESLGDPVVAISQELAFVTPSDEQITVDIQNRCVNVDLTENDTMALAENVKTQCQLAFVYSEETNDEEPQESEESEEPQESEESEEPVSRIIRFPIHDLSVSSTLMGSLI